MFTIYKFKQYKKLSCQLSQRNRAMLYGVTLKKP